MSGTQGPSAELTERVRELSDALLVLVLDAFREGRRQGERRVAAAVDRDVEALLAELEAQFGALDGADLVRLAACYEGADPSPLVAAHFGGAADVLMRLRGRHGRRGS